MTKTITLFFLAVAALFGQTQPTSPVGDAFASAVWTPVAASPAKVTDTVVFGSFTYRPLMPVQTPVLKTREAPTPVAVSPAKAMATVAFGSFTYRP